MQALINPGYISGTVKAPASKSLTQRAYAAALLHTGSSIIRNIGHSADENAALGIIRDLGAKTHPLADNGMEIISHGVQPVSDGINCGESGLSARLFAPIAAVSHLPLTIRGEGSLLQRPMEAYRSVFSELGIISPGFTGNVPFTVKGPLHPKDITVDGSQSSQFLSGLLFAYAFTAKEPTTITVTGLKSRAYIDLTLSILERYGKQIENDDYSSFRIKPSVSIESKPVEINVEGDWSSAAYWLAAAAINGEITVTNLDIESRQADKAILEILQYAGVSISISYEEITVRKSRLKAFDFDASEAPDLFPVLAVLGAYAEGETYITGLHRLWHKESNRATSIADMLLALDVHFSIEEDMLCIRGGTVSGGMVDSYNDHRIAMAAAIAAIGAKGPVCISAADSVNKSYPDFFRHLQSLHIDCSFE